MQPEDDRRDAVGEPDGDDAERAAGVEREPHQRDVVERVAELARRDREEEAAEVRPAQQRQGAGLGGGRLELARDAENGVGHPALLPTAGARRRSARGTSR